MIFKGISFRRNRTIEAYEDPSSPYVRFRYKSRKREIPLSGHSRTDMAYAEDGRVLLAKDGMVWTSTVSRAVRRHEKGLDETVDPE